jgi:hypothetical protein
VVETQFFTQAPASPRRTTARRFIPRADAKMIAAGLLRYAAGCI